MKYSRRDFDKSIRLWYCMIETNTFMESYEPPKLRYNKVCLLKKLRVLGIVTI
jgi:hypothetical protein